MSKPLNAQLPIGADVPRLSVDADHWAWIIEAMSDRVKLGREIAARTKPRFIEIPRERRGGKVPFTEEPACLSV